MKNCYTELGQRGVLHISGADTHTFLQGQTTCDVNQLTPSSAVAGAHCTPQGRMLCDFLALGCGEDNWLLSMHTDICNTSAAALGKYIVFSKAEIQVASSAWRVFAVWGDTAAALLDASGKNALDVWQQHDCYWVQMNQQGTRFECYAPAAAAEALQRQLADGCVPVTEQAWMLQEINAGVGHLEAATVDMFLPQMLNYQLTGRISFSKGCYTGQEVVARMHYRGKLKRPMYLASVHSAVAPQPAAPLFKAGSEQSIGNIVNVAADAGAYRLLAVVTSTAIDDGVHLEHGQGPQLTFHTLPYALAGEE